MALKNLVTLFERQSEQALGGTPKNLLLQDALLRAIEAGYWKAGDKLPSQTALVNALPISLGTVQKALSSLAELGVILFEHGRGTFVTGFQLAEKDLLHARFLRDGGESLLPVSSKFIGVDVVKEDGPWATYLNSGDFFIRIQSLLDINYEFKVLEEFYLEGDRFQSLLAVPIRQLKKMSLRKSLSEQFNAPTLSFARRVYCEVLPDSVCDIICVPLGTIGLMSEMFDRSYRNVPLLYQRFYIPPSHRRLEIME